MADGTASHPGFDLALRIVPVPEGLTTLGRALVKLTYAIDPVTGRLALTTPAPLVNDIEDESLEPRLPPHSDYWPSKRLVDVAVIGSAFAENGRAVPERVVELEVASRCKSIAVIGERDIAFTRSGQPRIGEPEPFVEMPLGLESAYGGLDGRVPFDWDNPEEAAPVGVQADWPGLYPRNPWGRGYLCVAEHVDGLTMPTQEDPRARLTEESLLAQPERWYEQPMPAYFDWTPINCFPRNLFFTIDCEPWFPPPVDERLPEIQHRLLPADYRSLLRDQKLGTPPHWRFLQESAPFQSFRQGALLAGEIAVRGMHPEHEELRFSLPDPPEIQMAFEKRRETPQAMLTSVEVRPADLLVSVTYTAEMVSPRMFLPGVHPKIPFGVIVNGDGPHWVQTPQTIKSAMEAAESES